MGRPDRKDTSGIIYLITFPNGKRYVGLTATTFEERKKSHISHRVTSDLPVHNALQKYLGSETWEIIDSASNWDELVELEKKYIDQLKTYISKNGYNLTYGGDGTVGYRHTDEQKRLNSSAKKKYFNDPQNRRKQSEATKKAHHDNPKQGKNHSILLKQRYSDLAEREKRSSEMTNYLSDEENLRIHAIQRGAREFLVFEKAGKFIGKWLTQSQCARDLSLDVGHLNACLKGRRKSHGGFVFIYKSNFNGNDEDHISTV